MRSFLSVFLGTRLRSLALVGLVTLSLFISTAGTILQSQPALADAQSDCVASGGVWEYSGSAMACMPGNTAAALPFVDIAKQDDWGSAEVLQANLYMRALYKCMSTTFTYGFFGSAAIKLSDASDFTRWDDVDILDGGPAAGILIDASDDGSLNCNNDDKGWVKKAFKLLGFNNDPIKALCTLGWFRYDSTKPMPGTYEDCLNGKGDKFSNAYNAVVNGTSTTVITTTASAFTSRLFESRGLSMNLSSANKYLLYRAILETEGKSCGAKPLIKRSEANSSQEAKIADNKHVVVKIVEGEGAAATAPEWIYEFASDRDEGWTVPVASYIESYNIYEKSAGFKSPAGDNKNTCANIKDAVNEYAAGYLAEVMAGTKVISDDAEVIDATCVVETDCGETTSSCAVEGIGWLVCPALSFMGDILETAFQGLADNFLAVKSQLFETDSGTFVAWGIFRNFANVAFVIVFLIIIFSQLSGVGITNYGVKKMLPRLVIAALLVNLSYFVCQLAVDLSNVLGYGIKSILDNVATLTEVKTSSDASADGRGIAVIVAAVIAAGAAAYFSLGILIPILLGAVVSILMVVLMLIARQAIVVLLVVLSPLAFVAFLLPNTESLFTKWRKAFMAMLLLFPIISVVFGISNLASQILLKAAEGTSNYEIMQIVAIGVAALPFFIVPTLLKGSLDGIGGVGAKLNGFAAKAGSGVGKGYSNSGFGKYRAGIKADREARISSGSFRGRGGKLNPQNWRSTANRALNSNRAFNAATGGFGAERELAMQAQNRKDQQEAMAMFGGDDDLVAAWAASGGDMKHAAFGSLNIAQQAQFKKMRGAGLHQKATSHLAAAQALADSGKGDTAMVETALASALSTGASATVVGGARQAALSGFRKSGRGDIVAGLQGQPPAEGWKEVAAANVHRDAIDATKNPTGAASYETFLRSDSENARQALVGFDSMEARAQNHARAAIIAAAQLHQYNATGAAPTITTVQDAKSYFGVK